MPVTKREEDARVGMLVLGNDEVHQLSDSAEYTEEDLLANAMYLFIVLVFITSVVAVISFGIREYTISLKKTGGSATDKKVLAAGWSPVEEEEEAEEEEEGVKEEAEEEFAPILEISEDSNTKKDIEQSRPTGTGLIQERTIDGYDQIIDTSLYKQGGYGSSNEEISSEERIEVMISSNISGGTFDEILEQDYTRSLKEVTKKKYTISEMQKIFEQNNRITLYYQRAQRYGTPIILSEVLKYTNKIPKYEFANAWEADKMISEIRNKMMNNLQLEAFDKNMIVLQLISIGSSNEVLDNENYYLLSFNELIENIIDTGAIIDILNELEGIIRTNLIEMILIYCWSHWNFKVNNKRLQQVIHERYQRWKFENYIISNHHIIFRILCNFKIGLSSIKFKNDRNLIKEYEFRLQLLFRECIKTSYCNEFMIFIPMLAQAVDISINQNIKYFFYDLLKIIITVHDKCCMKEYLQESKNTNLKALLQHGIWYKHDANLQKKVREIYQYLIEIFDTDNSVINNLSNWFKEIDGGKKFVASSAKLNSDPYNHLLQAPTPGSWTVH